MSNKNKFNFSFAGCGFMGMYQVGVASCIRQYTPHLVRTRVSGASAGAIAATFLLCDASISEVTKLLLDVATQARSRTLGPFSPSFNITKILRAGMDRLLPADAHLRANGKLQISLTRCHDRKNIIVSQFDSREELLEVVMCATFIPGFSGLVPPKYRGARHMDGGFTDNLPAMDEHTVTVSPYCGEADICPKDGNSTHMMFNISNTSFELSAKNLFRLSSTFFPPTPEILLDICQQGFDDALKFLARNDLIGCQTCISIQFPDSVPEENTMLQHPEDSPCHQCDFHKNMALSDSRLPDTVHQILREDIESGKRGFVNWLYSHQSVRVLSALTLPWILPADIAYATGVKLFENVPVPSLSFNFSSPNVKRFKGVLTPLLSQPLETGTCSNLSTFPVPIPMISLTPSNIIIEEDDSMEMGTEIDGYRLCVPTLNEVDWRFTDFDHYDIVREYNVPSRRPSLFFDDGEEDSFERFLTVTADQDTVVANYYINSENEVYLEDSNVCLSIPTSFNQVNPY